MTKFQFLRPDPETRLLRLGEVEQVVRHLRGGGLAVLPTETGWMLAAVATELPAVRAAFAVKQRDLAHPMHVACASLRLVARYAVLTEPARRLLGTFTPGPLSVVIGQRDTLPGELVTWQGTVGIRVPDHPATLQVLAELALPVTATSLNRSGEPPTRPDPSILDALDWSGQSEVPVVDDPAAVRFSDPSTLVRVTAGETEVIRPGPVSAAQVEQALAGAGPVPAGDVEAAE